MMLPQTSLGHIKVPSWNQCLQDILMFPHGTNVLVLESSWNEVVPTPLTAYLVEPSSHQTRASILSDPST